MELDERQLLEDLGDLASISSVEQLHEADLPELRRVAHELGDHPDDRTGRYAAIRDAITLAIDRIEDTAFADAAEALLGYNDRWRSVRDRGTDAGRAFTPTISYDAFRRKSGRNYRTNTLRMVADELQAALAGAPASPVDPEEPTTTNTVPDRSQINTPTAGSAAREPSGRMRRLMGVGLLGVLGGLIAVGVLLFGRGDPADQRASTVERTPASAASTTTVSPAATNAAITKSPPPTEQATPTVEEPTPEPEPAPTHAVGEVDVTRHCRGANDPEQDFYGVRTEDVEGGWACRSADGSLQRAPSISDACREQYGPSALPREDGGWACQIAFVDLVVPNNSTKNVGCAVPVGAYDRRALEVFERYSTRFVEAFGAADLPDTVCADGTMHLYGDPADTGITQLLVDGESSYGALLADDPLNVVVLTGEAWAAFGDIRGLAPYQFGIDLLEDRAGYPLGPARLAGGVWRIDLTGGGALVSDSRDGRFVWLPMIARALWEGHGASEGCLGMPLRSPLTDLSGSNEALEQEFEHGAVGIDPTGTLYYEPADVCA